MPDAARKDCAAIRVSNTKIHYSIAKNQYGKKHTAGADN